jgi:hypothetical protein
MTEMRHKIITAMAAIIGLAVGALAANALHGRDFVEMRAGSSISGPATIQFAGRRAEILADGRIEAGEQTILFR